MSQAGGEPAFPIPQTIYKGMTLRDWFAGMALNGIWSHQDLAELIGDDAAIAQTAYRMADAMLTQREKP